MNYYIRVLQNYANFSGRARRSEYWFFVLFNAIISIVLHILGLSLISTLYSLAVFIPGIAVAIRRMHDIDKCGWYILIPFYNIYLCCLEGTSGQNSYGPDSKLIK